MSLLTRITTSHKFSDGAMMSVLHKYSLRYDLGERHVEIGFEQASEPGIDRLIHEGTIVEWVASNGAVATVSAPERSEILARVAEYCRLKGLAYRVVKAQ